MRNIQRFLRTLAALALATAGFLGSAHAAPVVSISPSSQDIVVGQITSVDIIVSGLTQPGEAVGSFYILLDYDASLLDGLGFTLDPGAKMGAFDAFNDLSSGFDGLGSLDMWYFANLAETEASLEALQGGSFTLATVSFQGKANGLSPLTLTFADLSNFDGTALLNSSSQNGSICVGGNCNAVPEPGTYGLAGIALLAAGLASRRRRPSAPD